MGLDLLHKSVILYLTWLGFITTVLWVSMTEVLSLNLPFLSSENVYHGLIFAELIFILFFWPPFLRAFLVERNSTLYGVITQVAEVLLQVVALLLLAMPLTLICQNISSTDWATILKSHFYIFTLAFFLTGIFFFSNTKRQAHIVFWYYALLLLMCGGFLLVYYFVLEYYDTNLLQLVLLSPFSSVFYIGSKSAIGDVIFVQSLIFAFFGIVLILISIFWIKKHRRQAA